MNRGKSTLTSFIKSILYGINKNKDGNEYSEFETFKPWTNEKNFSGSMIYENDGEEFLLTRNFSSNTAKIYNSNNEEISSQYNKSKQRGLEIGFEQLGIDEETFTNTSLVKQNGVGISAIAQNSIIQKLTNIIQSGNENSSYEDCKKKLEKILYEEVGT